MHVYILYINIYTHILLHMEYIIVTYLLYIETHRLKDNKLFRNMDNNELSCGQNVAIIYL